MILPPFRALLGDRLSIPPSHFHAANLEELVMQYIVEAKNDVLPCHLTVHMPPATGGGGSGGGGAGGGEGRREGDHGGLAGNAIMAAIPREFQVTNCASSGGGGGVGILSIDVQCATSPVVRTCPHFR